MIQSKLIWLFLAGGAGTLARYGLAGLVQRMMGSQMPMGTLAVNVVGCFLFGVVTALAAERQVVSAETRLLVAVGFLGAFTTFSTFAYETGAMLQDSQWGLAIINILLQNTIGIAALFLGMAAARLF